MRMLLPFGFNEKKDYIFCVGLMGVMWRGVFHLSPLGGLDVKEELRLTFPTEYHV